MPPLLTPDPQKEEREHDLTGALGVKPKPARWKDKTFDRLWIIKPTARSAQFQDLPQRLLKSDSKR